MISDIVVTGTLGKKINSYLRELIIENFNNLTAKKENFIIPIADWFKNENGKFHNLKEGTFVFIRGRIESEAKIGLYVVAETLEIYSHGHVSSM
ncbi:MAG: hypothetical protein RBR85_01960 [Bacilli bacterium]|jgi:hypothetical protein|nr:hypothetical protein [Bacilli bacterium]